METANDYHVNMFKMKSPYARANARLIITMIIVWFTAVIGFQILLKVIEKKVPEKTFITFREYHPKAISGEMNKLERGKYARSILLTLAKNPAKKDKMALLETFHFAMKGLGPNLAMDLGVQENSLEMKVLPYFMEMESDPVINPETENIMAKYLIHNRSFLTDTKFLGFPFHYWYTAEFLLILFVLLCWFYCFKINRLQIKYNIKDE